MFNDKATEKIRKAAKQTKFIQGMVEGTLNPVSYGGYMVQDAAYCFKAVEAYDYAAEQMQKQGETELSSLYSELSGKFKGYNQDFISNWRLKSSDSVVLGPAAKSNVDFESDVSRKDAKFLCIAMLPCTMLWPWIAGELIGDVKPENPYYFWFKDNKRNPGHKSHLEQFVDRFCKPEDKKKSLDIFHQGLVHELNFFRDACGEPLRSRKSIDI